MTQAPVAPAGTCAEAFAPLHDLLADNLGNGTELGASLAVVQDGELVVDLWGGEARPGETWREDTLVQVEVDGVRLLSPATIDRIFEVQADGADLVLMAPLRWGIGYGLPQPMSAPAVPEGRVCWWTGYGGAIVVNDLDRPVTVAYAMNRMVDHFVSSPRTDAYVRTAFDCVELA